eukprot:GHVH01000573.1.p1 GENE.GHVH01000573.1~~GHVH01000573.1.p1  ORF type:complete len:107 (+),score=10.01 GHVH01000573.1:824-1144(+)
MGNPYATDEAIQAFDKDTTTLMVLHGRKDNIIPFDQGSDLINIYKGKKHHHIFDNRSHCDISEVEVYNSITVMLKSLPGGNDLNVKSIRRYLRTMEVPTEYFLRST